MPYINPWLVVYLNLNLKRPDFALLCLNPALLPGAFRLAQGSESFDFTQDTEHVEVLVELLYIFHDDLRPKAAIGNQCSIHLSAKRYDLSYLYVVPEFALLVCGGH